ncbi:MAG: DUF87 domain-containing protein [Candidatus Omnitrophica bacterium]|nr:DUF87 domain-containing protein [Candidatus Omnitrophota bacterium]
MQKINAQFERLFIALLYFGALCIINLILFGRFLPDISLPSNIWFYVASIMIIFGTYLIEPFYSKPVDVISSSVVFITALLGVNNKEFFCWHYLIITGIFFLLLSIVIVILQPNKNERIRKFSEALFIVDTEIGKSTVLFSLLFLGALLTYFRSEPVKFILLLLFWFCLVSRLFDKLWVLVRRLAGLIKQDVKFDYVGKLIRMESSSLGVVECINSELKKNALVVIFYPDQSQKVALVIHSLLLNDRTWARIFFLDVDLNLNEFALITDKGTKIEEPKVYVLQDLPNSGALKTALEKNNIYKDLISLVGFISEQSNVKEIRFSILNPSNSIKEGQLIRVQVGEDSVLYQIIDGETSSQQLESGNKYGFIVGRARKIGKWNSEKHGFEMVRWLPQPHTPVFLVPSHAEEDKFLNFIGRVPGTDFSITLDCDRLVTHNVAILGILGIGKSYLAFEIISKLVKENIKVLCLDISGQYRVKLKDYGDYDVLEDEKFEHEIQAKLQPLHNKVQQNVADGGSLNEFRKLIKEDLRKFMVGAVKLKVYDPDKLTVYRQDSKLFSGTASMAELSTAEITRVISEQLLEIVKIMGATDEKARVCLVFEEAHSLIPEWNSAASEGDKAAANGTAKTILQGRKYGLGCMVVTQRTANVTKSILNQCNTIFAMRVFDATGMDFLSNYIGEDYTNALSTIEDRKAVIFGRASSSNSPLIIQLNDKDLYLKKLKEDRGTV